MISNFQQLMASFRQVAAAASTTESFAAALNGVVGAYETTRIQASPGSVDRSLQTMTNGFLGFTNDLDLIGPSSWTTVASAFHAAGKLVLMRGETPTSSQRVEDLYRAAARFAEYTRARPSQRQSLTPQALFFNDRALADMILDLKGWSRRDSRKPQDLRPLGTVLAQVGLASGMDLWPEQVPGLPNLAGAFWVFFDGGSDSLLNGVELLKPFSYFEAAAEWRPETLGYQEMILASLMDGHTIGTVNIRARQLADVFPHDRLLQTISCLIDEITSNDGSRREILEALIKNIEQSPTSSESRHDANLPAFLRMAMESLN